MATFGNGVREEIESVLTE